WLNPPPAVRAAAIWISRASAVSRADRPGTGEVDLAMMAPAAGGAESGAPSGSGCGRSGPGPPAAGPAPPATPAPTPASAATGAGATTASAAGGPERRAPTRLRPAPPGDRATR